MKFLLLSLIAPLAALGAQILLPELSGPHQIGLTNLELIDHTRSDPFSPTTAPRDLMVTLFYPTSSNHSSEPPQLASQFPPITASHIDTLLSLSPGTAASLSTRAHLNAPIVARSAGLPVVLFSPGFGLARGMYTTLLSDLASHGWVAAAIDHPYDAAVVEYPDGRTVAAANWTWPLEPEVRELALQTRTADLMFVSECLGDGESGVAPQVVGMGARMSDEGNLELRNQCPGTSETEALNVSRVVSLGHSFGGAAAVQVLQNSSAVVAAADLDGFLYGPVVRSETDKPVLVLGFPEHFATDDPDAPPGWPSLQGWKRDFTVAGTVHVSYCDYPVLVDIVESGGPDAGTVPGIRMVEIMRTYVGAFFGKFLLGVDDQGFLSENSTKFDEVSLRRQGT